MATSLQRNQERPVEDLEDPNLLLLEPQSFRSRRALALAMASQVSRIKQVQK